MIKENIQDNLNQQINKEMYSYYLYLSMSAYFEDIDLPGFGQWMKAQAQEEMSHAMKIFDFIIERGGKVTLLPIKGPQTDWKNPLDAFEAAYKHECYISDCINKLVDQALAESDHATNAFLQWFVNEQVEEEASVDAIVKKLKLVAGHPNGTYMIDKELGARVFASAADTGEASA